ncbi:MAG: ribonuclease H-like domain-containing protein [candidate division KSB1 bacterium]|nr:ribonuclease H-like domain-containing protein [candidate division KSB1 bacterium]MDZ7341237.1 ribonuclease H-like domain-containing protein [candidate division KSB1 bacterium]
MVAISAEVTLEIVNDYSVGAIVDIKEKLQFLEKIQQPPKSEPYYVPLHPDLSEFIPGQVIATPYGGAFVRVQKFSLDHNHGLIQLGQINEISPYVLQLAGKDQNLLQLNFKESIFLDTETTGLSGGSGTLIFLLGMGYFADDDFVLKQFFLRELDEELALLYLVHEELGRFRSFISFNGKAFDWPLLQSRFIYHRLKNELVDPPHLDLLHAARRIWKGRLQDCSLSNLEQKVLQVQRHGDIPSYLIPHLYFEYLRTKDPLAVKPIFYHNEVDVLSMVSLTILLHRIHAQPLQELDDSLDLSTLARFYENTRQWQRNISIYQTLLQDERSNDRKNEYSLQLSYCYKRLGQWAEAVEIWDQLIRSSNVRFEAFEELAKYYEHRVRDLKMAEKIAASALERLELLEQFSHGLPLAQWRSEFSRRLQRIRQKLAAAKS